MRKPQKYKVYNLLHRFGAHGLQLMLMFVVGKIGYDVYYWRRYQLPARKEETRKFNEEQLAQKQAEEAEQLAKQEILQEEVKKIQ